MDSIDYHLSFRVSVVGDSSTGKSTLVARHVGVEEYQKLKTPKHTTIHQGVGISFKTQNYKLADRTYRVEFWDAPGSDQHRAWTARLCGGNPASVFVFSMNDRRSFERIAEWEKALGYPDPVVKVLVGNKADVIGELWEVKHMEAEQFASEHDMLYFELSAERSEESVVHYVFNMLVDRLHDLFGKKYSLKLLMKYGVKVGKLHDKGFRRPHPGDAIDCSETVDWFGA
mmetsp:Transcript_10575/g.17314  ORF Transcript_10575/g.17314 Transcript_10575/m.17314 type:complete len:228 (-) Transcript_10575:178-861(-)|eukprot:CAMPEP_0184666468 /NCGR_PEP_ID=MMETSP0308-20130426/61918_1 /TAXON_ID=38269 /ORGANISM="Gloeochaete witrockiana, Strain SAG 46.84" /LENGTH=227 /DNA_ID=CAMNT_0027111071 /DNA_START=38 /DNA_END=721 /DNA_ORIENTATION=+